MTVRPQTELVKRRFAGAAAAYDAAAWHQDRIAEALCRALPPRPAPCHIVEWGCGTGLLTARLVARWPRAALTVIDLAGTMLARCRERLGAAANVRFVQADAECHLVAEPADLLVSSCTVQWFRHPLKLARHAARQVAPGGQMALAVPVQGTLRELWECLDASGYRGPAGLPLHRPEEIAALFEGPLWREASVRSATFTQYHPDARAVLRALRDLGATCTGHDGWRRIPAAQMRRLLDLYKERHTTRRGVRCTYVAAIVLARRTLKEAD